MSKYISRQICWISQNSNWLISKGYMNVRWSPFRKMTVIIIIYYLFIFKYLKQNFDNSVNRSTFVVNAAMHNQVWPLEYAKVQRKYTKIKRIGNFLGWHSTFVLFVAGEIYAIVNLSHGFCNICKVMSVGGEKQSQHWF